MKAITHNLLVCNVKGCANTDKNYPFIVKASKVENAKKEFDLEKTKALFEKQNKVALNQFCQDLGIAKYDFTNLEEKIKEDANFWEYVHALLFESLVIDGFLICPNCKREFLIKDGIVDMVLKDDEM